MDRKKRIGLVGGVLVLIVAVVGVSMVWAAYTQNLVINGGATTKGAKWSIKFENLGGYAFNNTTANKYNLSSQGCDELGKCALWGEIEGDTTLNVGNDFFAPGDTAVYEFDITNSGDFDAKIDTGFSIPSPTCGRGSGNPNTTDADIALACGQLIYSLKWDDSSEIKSGDILEAGQTRGAVFTIEYDKSIPINGNIGPGKYVVLENNFTIPFVQK